MPYVPIAQDTDWQRSDSIDVRESALLVVDILGGSEGVIPELQEMADNAARIVAAAHDARMPVLFACDAHIEGLDHELPLWGNHGIAGTEAAKPLATLGVEEGDFVIPKRRYDSFFETDLDLTLRELGVRTLIVIGCDTNICVQQTLAGAYYRTYRTIVAADATATFLVGTQEAGLEYFTRCFDTRVVDTETVLGYLEGAGA